MSSTISARVAVMRLSVNIDTAAHVVEIPEQRILCGDSYYLLPATRQPYEADKLNVSVVYNTVTGQCSVKYLLADKLAEDEYTIIQFTRTNPRQAAIIGSFTVDGENPSFEDIRRTGNFQNQGTDDTNFSWWVYPEAVHFTGMCDKLYWGYTDSHGYIGIMSYDLDTGLYERKVLMKSDTRVVSNGVVLSEQDNHNDCAVNILPDGRLLCVCAMHATTSRNHVFISKHPESISEFEDRTDLFLPEGYNRVTYAQVIACGGSYHLFFRCMAAENVEINGKAALHFYWGYRSTVDGVTWTDFVPLVDGANSDHTASYQYYLRAAQYDDTHIKLMMQSNASQQGTELRLGYLNVVSGDLLTGDWAQVLGNVRNPAAWAGAVPFDRFPVLVDKPAVGYQRLVAVGEGTDNSVVLCSIQNPTQRVNDSFNAQDGHSYTTQYYRWSTEQQCYEGPYQMPDQGIEWGPNYQNGVDLVDRDMLVSCENTGSGWQTCLYRFEQGSFQLLRVLDSTNNPNVKLFVPLKVENSDWVMFNRGYFNGMDYNDFFTRIVLKRWRE